MIANALVGLGFLLSPRAFMISGSGIGLAGYWYIAVVALLLATHFATLPSPFLTNEKSSTGTLATFGYAVRFFSLAFFSCSILGVSGYAFNEVFLYWFPNFLFSFILLTCSFLTSLMPYSTARKIQLAATIIILGGLVVLSVAALWAPAPKGAETPGFFLPHGNAPFFGGLVFMAPLLVGYELYASASAKGRSLSPAYALSLGLAALFLSLFAYAALSVSGAEKLANSTVPHMIGARRILGQTGRYIMGGIVILGSFAAFNAVLMYLKAPLETHMHSLTPGRIPKGGLTGRAIASAIPTLTVSLLLLLGYAGEPITESYIAGGFALWFVSYGLPAVSSLSPPRPPLVKTLKILGVFSCFSLACALLSTPEEPLKGFLVAAVASFILAALGRMGRKRLSP